MLKTTYSCYEDSFADSEDVASVELTFTSRTQAKFVVEDLTGFKYIVNCDVVIDEAKILAKPIIATAYPTVKDQIQNDNEGIIVELNVNGIVNGIVALCSDNVKKQQITEYLNRQEYGNQEEIMKYIKLFDK